jgi:hypothetical protein
VIPEMICTGRGTHDPVEAEAGGQHVRPDVIARGPSDRTARRFADGDTDRALMLALGSVEYRCPECGRTERFGGRRFARLAGSGLDVVDISWMPH